MSIASLFRLAPAAVGVSGGRHASPETDERPGVPFNPAPGRHAAEEDDEPAFDVDVDEDLLDSLGFAYAD